MEIQSSISDIFLLRNLVQEAVAAAALQSLTFVFAMLDSLPHGGIVLPKEPDSLKWLPIAGFHNARKPDMENKDAEGEDDGDDDDDVEADEKAEDDEGEEVNDEEADPEDEPTANGEGEEEEDDKDDDDDDNDDDGGDDEENGDEEEEEEEEEEERPSKKRKGA